MRVVKFGGKEGTASRLRRHGECSSCVELRSIERARGIEREKRGVKSQEELSPSGFRDEQKEPSIKGGNRSNFGELRFTRPYFFVLC